MRRFVFPILVTMLVLSPGLASQPTYSPDLNQKLTSLAGEEPGDCGLAEPTTSPIIFMKAYDCLMRAKVGNGDHGKKAFKFAILLTNDYERFYAGALTDKDGKAHLFRYKDSDLKLNHEGSFEAEDCPSGCLGNFFDAAIEMSNHLSTRLR